MSPNARPVQRRAAPRTLKVEKLSADVKAEYSSPTATQLKAQWSPLDLVLSPLSMIAEPTPQVSSRRSWLYAILTLVAVVALSSIADAPQTLSGSLYNNVKSRLSRSRPRINLGIAPFTPIKNLVDGLHSFSSDEPGWEILKDWKFADGRDLKQNMTCLTYEERYADVFHGLSKDIPVPPVKGATTALLRRIRAERLQSSTMGSAVTEDDLFSNRALIAELQRLGIDVYFLVNHSPPLESQEEMEAWKAGLLPEYQGRVFSFDYEAFMARFPPGTFKGEVWYDNHVSLNAFMESNIGSQYNFAWWLESDVRSTGSWAAIMSFLNATVPVKEPPIQAWELRSEHRSTSTSDSRYQPDLFLTSDFLPVQVEERDLAALGPQCSAWARDDQKAKALINFTGFSRRLHDEMMALYDVGFSCFCENFSPTVAKRTGLRIHAAELPSRRNPAAHPKVEESTTWAHWFPEAASVYYNRWKNDPLICRPSPQLLHKVVPGYLG